MAKPNQYNHSNINPMIVIANNTNAIQFDDNELIQICINNNWQSIYPQNLINALQQAAIEQSQPELIAFESHD